MKILFLSVTDPKQKNSWSGTTHFLYSTLCKKHMVEWLPATNYKLIRLIFALYTRLKSILFRKRFIYTHTILFSRIISWIYSKALKGKEFDLVFAPNISFAVAFLKTEKPVIMLDDSYFPDLFNYNSYLSNLHHKQIEDAKLINDKALQTADHIILPSVWVANSASRVISRKKISLIRFGANLESIPEKNILRSDYHSEILKLLFVGVDWKRKGGEIAVETFEELKQLGYKVQLTIVGCNPRIVKNGVTIFPFLDKNNSSDIKVLYKLYMESTFFILPTRAECAGIVFCEASAFGLPVITTDVGGIPDYVEEGVNGYRLNLNDRGKDYASKISTVFENKSEYLKLRWNSRKKYEEELNWDIWLEKFDKVADSLIIRDFD